MFNWLQQHGVAVVIAGAALITALGLALAWDAIPTTTKNAWSSWSQHDGIYIAPAGESEHTSTQLSPRSFGEQTRPNYLSLIPQPTYTGTSSSAHAAADPYDIDALLGLLSPETGVTSLPETTITNMLSDIYAFLPTGLSSGASVSTEEELTETQEQLLAYANTAGAHIQTYERTYQATQNEILIAVLENPHDSAARAAAHDIAGGLTELGGALAAMSNVPAPVMANHNTLLNGYFDAGELLHDVIDVMGGSDDELLGALEAYNGAVEELSGGFVGISDTLAAYRVPIDEHEPAGVFVFTFGSL